MSLSFSTLTADKTTSGSIRRWVNYAPLDAEYVLEEAQTLLFQSLRVREMRTEFTDLSMVQGDFKKALPAGFLDIVKLYDKTNNIRLSLRDEEWLVDHRYYDSGTINQSTPSRFAIYDESFQFECAYDAAATLNLVGFKQPDLLSNNNQTNFLTTRYPQLLRVACLAQAYDFLNNDARQQANLSILAALIDKTNAESDLSYRGVEMDIEIHD